LTAIGSCDLQCSSKCEFGKSREAWFGTTAAKKNQMESTIIAIDPASAFPKIHYVHPETGAIHSKALKRAHVAPFLA